MRIKNISVNPYRKQINRRIHHALHGRTEPMPSLSHKIHILRGITSCYLFEKLYIANTFGPANHSIHKVSCCHRYHFIPLIKARWHLKAIISYSLKSFRKNVPNQPANKYLSIYSLITFSTSFYVIDSNS